MVEKDPTMHGARDVETKRYKLVLYTHEATGHIVATSDELPGLFVQGKNREEVRARAPKVVQRMLERNGMQIHNVGVEPSAPEIPREIKVESFVTVVAEFDLAA